MEYGIDTLVVWHD